MTTKRPKQRTVNNVQSLPENGRSVIHRKVYTAYKAGLTKYIAAIKCDVHERTVGRWYAKFSELEAQAIQGCKRSPKPGGEKHRLSDNQLLELRESLQTSPQTS